MPKKYNQIIRYFLDSYRQLIAAQQSRSEELQRIYALARKAYSTLPNKKLELLLGTHWLRPIGPFSALSILSVANLVSIQAVVNIPAVPFLIASMISAFLAMRNNPDLASEFHDPLADCIDELRESLCNMFKDQHFITALQSDRQLHEDFSSTLDEIFEHSLIHSKPAMPTLGTATYVRSVISSMLFGNPLIERGHEPASSNSVNFPDASSRRMR